MAWQTPVVLAEENLRLATKEELALTEPIRDEMTQVGDVLRDASQQNIYKDLRPPPPERRKRIGGKRKPKPPEESHEKKARLMMQGTRAVRSLMKDRMKRGIEMQRRQRAKVRRGVKRKPPEEAQPAEPRAERMQARLEAPPQRLQLEDGRVEDPREAEEEMSEEDQLPVPPAAPGDPAGLRPQDVPIPEESEEEEEEPNDDGGAIQQQWDQHLRGMTAAERRRSALDDVPASVKRRLHPDEEEELMEPPAKKSRVSESLVTQVMLGTLGEEDEPERANEWISRYELALLQELTGLPITAARLHRQPRKKFARPPKMVSRSRLSILIGEDPRDAYVVEEDENEVQQNPRRKAPFLWKGITMYWKEKAEKKKGKVKSYVEKGGEVYEVNWSSRQRKLFEKEWADEMKDILMSEVMLLKLKQSGKELDPRFFSPEP